MRRDFYSYGRSEPNRLGSSTRAPAEVESFVCTRCGCSACAADAQLMLSLGWRILPGHDDDLDRPALCAACRKGLRGIF